MKVWWNMILERILNLKCICGLGRVNFHNLNLQQNFHKCDYFTYRVVDYKYLLLHHWIQSWIFSLLENSFNFCDSWVRWRFQIHSWPVRPAQIRVTEQPACPGYHKIGHIFSSCCSVHPKHLQLTLNSLNFVLIQMPRLFGVTAADDSLPAEHLLKGL